MSCPVCGEATLQHYRPFCSKRCADIDLGKWLNEGYVIPDSSPLSDEKTSEDGTPGPVARH